MHIKAIEIKGFRNYYNCSFQFEKGLNVIIGGNNSGKTNLLHALQVIKKADKMSLHDFNMNMLKAWQHDARLSEDVIEPPEISITYDVEHLINTKNYDDGSIEKLRSFLKLSDTEAAVVDEEDKDYSFTLSARIKIVFLLKPIFWNEYFEKAKDTKNFDNYIKLHEKYIQHYEWKHFNAENDYEVDNSEARDIFDIEFVKADRSTSEIDTNSSNLYKMIRKKLKYTDETVKMQINTILTKDAKLVFSEIQDKLDSSYKEIGIANGNVTLKPTVQFDAQMNQYYSLGLCDNKGNYDIPIENNGLGYNNLVAIYLLLLGRDITEINTHSIVLLEEPEAHLHPAMQYKLFKYINTLQKSEKQLRQQIFVTTHSSNITAVSDIDRIIDLKYDRENTPNDVCSVNLGSLFDASNEESKNHIIKFLDVTRSDMLFGDKVILVEGITEKLLMPLFLKKANFDMDDHHISVVEIGGKWIKHFLYLFPPERKTKVLCITDCDNEVLNETTLSVSKYTTTKYLTEARKIFAYPKWVSIKFQNKDDWGRTFEDQLIMDNFDTLSLDQLKKLFTYVLPQNLIDFMEKYDLDYSKWKTNIDSINKKTKPVIERILKPIDNYVQTNKLDNQTQKKCEKLLFAKIFKHYSESQKGNLALSLITDDKISSSLVVPRYIKEGIEWLKK